MYKVLVIEDEDIIRRGLIQMVDWSALECRVIGEASNGVNGLKAIESLKPDIVIVDINMPIMNGIELLEALPRDTFSTIIISGHSEFEYAKKAITYGVCEYLLKPLDANMIVYAIQKAILEIERRKHYVEEHQVEDPYLVLNKSMKTDSVTLLKVINYIDEHYQEKITLEDLTDYSGKSHTSLNKRFQRDFNMTFSDYLSRYRIQKAIDIMKSTEHKIYEISEMVGFSDYKYFNTVFKKIVGETPKLVQLYYLRNKGN